MPDVRRVVDELLRPEPEDFWPSFWRRAEARERRSAKRWRAAALGLAAGLLVAGGAAGVLAAPAHHGHTTVENLSCGMLTGGRRPLVSLAAVPTRSIRGTEVSGRPHEAQLLLTTGSEADFGTRLFQIDAVTKGSLVDTSRCTPSSDRAAPTPHGLALTDDLRAGVTWGRVYDCTESRVRVHVRLTTDKAGLPTAVQLEIDTPARRPLLYVDWRPARVRLFRSDACTTSDIGF